MVSETSDGRRIRADFERGVMRYPTYLAITTRVFILSLPDV
jgi:hypothetical protein